VRQYGNTYSWTTESQFSREIKQCDYCKGAGVFSGSKIVQVKPGVNMRYFYTFRCKNCQNWNGLYGEKIRLAYPLEIKTEGMFIHLNGSPLEGDATGRQSLSEVIENIGTRVNQKTNRPDFLPYKDDEEIPF
jgi:hypothetical protein